MTQRGAAAATTTGEIPAVSAPEELFAPRSGDDTGQKRNPFARLILRMRTSGLDLRNTWQVMAGAILLPLGIAVIILGWSGAAHGRVDQQQIPYIISGGVLGLAAVIVGSFFFWAHWLYRIYDQADLQHQESMRQQSELMRYLIETVAYRDGEQAAPTGIRGSGFNGAATEFVATPTGTNFHRRSCPIIATRSTNLRTVSPQETSTMRPCRICEPLEAAEGG